MDHFVAIDFSEVNKKEIKTLTFFWLGFMVYTLSYTLSITTYVNYSICQLGQLAGVFVFLISSFFLVRIRFENTYLRVVFTLYILWLLSVVYRGESLNGPYLKILIFDDYVGVFPYLAPLILLFPQNILSYKILFKVIFTLSVFYLVYDLIFIKALVNKDVEDNTYKFIVESFTKNLCYPITFMLLTFSYHSRKVNIYSFCLILLALFFAVIKARRGLLFIFAAPLAYAYIIYLLKSEKKTMVVIVSIISFSLIGAYGVSSFNNSGIFHSVKERATEDTRTKVEDCFYDDMKEKDWIIGRGIAGQYYCPNIDEDDTTGFRVVIETDYLNIILKGGLISLGLLGLIIIPATVQGLFYSNNNLAKGAAFWLLGWMLSLYPTTGVAFNLSYLLVWLCVGICFNKRIRNIPDNLLKLYFSKLDLVLRS